MLQATMGAEGDEKQGGQNIGCPIKEAQSRFGESGKREEHVRRSVQEEKVCELVILLCSETETF